jgi:hypothetical protein
LRKVSEEVLLTNVPELKETLQVLAGVTFADTRKLHPIV